MSLERINPEGQLRDELIKVTNNFNALFASKAGIQSIRGKRFVSFGDSRTNPTTSWAFKAATALQLSHTTYAVGGTTWAHIYTALESCKAATDANSLLIPDLAITAYGANFAGAIGDFDTVINMSYEDLEAYMYAQRITMTAETYYSVRYAVETIRRRYPNCKIMIQTPLISMGSELNYYSGDLIVVSQAIMRMANYMSVPLINGVFETGMVSWFEYPHVPHGQSGGNYIYRTGRYLADGLHPSPATGDVLQGNYNIREILRLWHSNS